MTTTTSGAGSWDRTLSSASASHGDGVRTGITTPTVIAPPPRRPARSRVPCRRASAAGARPRAGQPLGRRSSAPMSPGSTSCGAGGARDHLRQRCARVRGHRRAAGERLDHGQPVALLGGWEDEYVGGGVERGELGVGHTAGEKDPARRARAPPPPSTGRRARAAARRPPPPRRQRVEPLARVGRVHAADPEQEPLGQIEPRELRARIVDAAERGVRRLGHDDDLRRQQARAGARRRARRRPTARSPASRASPRRSAGGA